MTEISIPTRPGDARQLQLVRGPVDPEPLWREVVGARLRRIRQRRGWTLVEVASAAGISPQYLSEVERGRKDPSSEILAAVAGALQCPVVDLTALASTDLRRQRARSRSSSTLSSGRPAPHRAGDVRLAA